MPRASLFMNPVVVLVRELRPGLGLRPCFDYPIRAVFARMLAAPPALAIAGRMKKGASERARALFAMATR